MAGTDLVADVSCTPKTDFAGLSVVSFACYFFLVLRRKILTAFWLNPPGKNPVALSFLHILLYFATGFSPDTRKKQRVADGVLRNICHPVLIYYQIYFHTKQKQINQITLESTKSHYIFLYILYCYKPNISVQKNNEKYNDLKEIIFTK